MRRTLRAALCPALCPVLCIVLAAQPAPPKDRTTKALKDAGELGEYGLPAAALAMTLLDGNRQDTAAFLWSIGTTALITQALKASIPKQRPNFSATDGFPSGHTAAAFSGALFIQDRKGWAWGGPALGLAALTAYGRVRGGEHGWDDVAAGFGIALLDHVALASSTPGRRLWIAPFTLPDASGVQVGLRTGASAPEGRGEFLLRMADPEIERPDAPGLFSQAPDRTPTSGMRLTLIQAEPSGPDRLWTFEAAPQTSQAFRILSAPAVFAGALLPAGTELASQTVLVDLRGTCTFRIGSPEAGGSLGAGAGLAYGDHEEAFALKDQPWRREQATAFLPVARVEGAWDPVPWIEARITGEAGSLHGRSLREAEAAVRLRFARGYGLEAAWRDTRWTFLDDPAGGQVRVRGLSLGLELAW